MVKIGIRSIFAKPLAHFVSKRLYHQAQQKKAIESQHNLLYRLVRRAAHTQFGQDHQFDQIKQYRDYKKRVPIRDYEGLKPYVERIMKGERNILWPGRPLYFAKTSGTTSGTKYIPITRQSIGTHIQAARNALLTYIQSTGDATFLDGQLIFLSGSPTLTKTSGILTGRLSGISNHHVPAYLRSNQLPSYETNCIEDWEVKVEKIVEETIQADLRLISGIPPWMQLYFDLLISQVEKPITEIFPNLKLIIHGGVNFKPYEQKMLASLGKTVDMIELYPASEGFIAYQDGLQTDGLLLNLQAGIFYEFIPADAFFEANPPRLSLSEVELDTNYALIINSNAGLWGYSIGDTIKFIDKNPYRLVVTGRIKHFISAFGEHVISEEVESAITTIAHQSQISLKEFTVAPMVNPSSGLPYHEWFIELDDPSVDLTAFSQKLDALMCTKNSYYADLIKGKILQPLKIRLMPVGAFKTYMQSIGKFGGQNKVPHLSNDRKMADFLTAYQGNKSK